MKNRILIVDDEESIRKLLKSRLDREGYEVVTASNCEEAEKAFGANGNGFGTVITDLKMPGKDGFQLMETFKPKNTNTKFIVITGHGEKEAAIKAVKYGATDYMEKPFDLEDLTRTVKRCQKEYALTVENSDLVARLEARLERAETTTASTGYFASQAASMTKVNEWISVLKREAARADAEEPTVLILGESGAGKEGIARQVQNASRRSKGPWVAVNCANFNEQLLESELFGHEKGAFTGANMMKRGLFEIAKGGTLFLDEIGEMDVKLQAKLLRVLQEKMIRRVGGTVDIETDVRIVAATNANLQSKVASGKFREDLYHRISRVVIELPALRDRKEDIVPMAKYFATRAFQARGKNFPGFTPEAEITLQNYSWPGNVREMLNVIERTALVHVGTDPISGGNLNIGGTKGATVIGFKPTVINGGSTNPNGPNGGPGGGGPGGGLPVSAAPTFGETGSYMDLKKKWVDSFEREYLTNTLMKHEGNVSAAAREARLDRSNFLRLLRRHAIKAQDFRKVGTTEEQYYAKVA